MYLEGFYTQKSHKHLYGNQFHNYINFEELKTQARKEKDLNAASQKYIDFPISPCIESAPKVIREI